MTGRGPAAYTMTIVATGGQGAAARGGGRRRFGAALGVLAAAVVLATALGFTFVSRASGGPSGGPSGSSAPGQNGPTGPAALGIPGLTGTWSLKLDDEFTGSRLDRSLWHTCYSWGCTISPADPPATNANPENEWYESANVTQRGGVLQLTARPQSAHGRDYTSGMIQSNGRFDFTYGVVEVRAKVPQGVGTWPAIWLVPENLSWPPEIDIMEYWGAQPDQVRVSLHFGAADQVEDRVVDSSKFTSGYHTYAVDWTPSSISWYIDGTLVFATPQSVAQPMYPIVNLAVQDPPAPAAGTFPASFDVQWIHIYQQSGVGTSTCNAASCAVPG